MLRSGGVPKSRRGTLDTHEEDGEGDGDEENASASRSSPSMQQRPRRASMHQFLAGSAESVAEQLQKEIDAKRKKNYGAANLGFDELQANIAAAEETMNSQQMSQQLQRLLNSTQAIATYAAFYSELIPMERVFVSRAVKADRRRKCGTGSDFAEGNKKLVAMTSLRRLVTVTRIPHLPLQIQALRALRMVAMEDRPRTALLEAGFGDLGKRSFVKHIVSMLKEQAEPKSASASLVAVNDQDPTMNAPMETMGTESSRTSREAELAGSMSSTHSHLMGESPGQDSAAVHIANVLRQRHDAERQQRRLKAMFVVECIWLLFTLSFKEVSVSEMILESEKVEHILVRLTSSMHRGPRLAAVALLANLTLAYNLRKIAPAFDTLAMRRLIFAAQFGDVTMKGEAARLLDNMGEDPSFRQKLDIVTSWEERDVQVWLQAVGVAAWLQLSLSRMRIGGSRLLQVPYPFYMQQLLDAARGRTDRSDVSGIEKSRKVGAAATSLPQQRIEQRLHDVQKLVSQVHQLKLKEVLRWNKPKLLFRVKEERGPQVNADLMQGDLALFDTADMFGADCIYRVIDADGNGKSMDGNQHTQHAAMRDDVERRQSFARVCTPRDDVVGSPLHQISSRRAQRLGLPRGTRSYYNLTCHLNISKELSVVGEVGDMNGRLLHNHSRQVKILRQLRNAPGIIEMVNCSVTQRSNLRAMLVRHRESSGLLNSLVADLELQASNLASTGERGGEGGVGANEGGSELKRPGSEKTMFEQQQQLRSSKRDLHDDGNGNESGKKTAKGGGGGATSSGRTMNSEEANSHLHGGGGVRHVFTERFHDSFNSADMVPGPAPDGNFYLIFEKGQFTLDQYLRGRVDDHGGNRLTRDRCKVNIYFSHQYS